MVLLIFSNILYSKAKGCFRWLEVTINYWGIMDTAISTVLDTEETPEISVQEKILLEKQLPLDLQKKGPSVDLYFHELVKGKSAGQKALGLLISFLLTIGFIVSFPVVAAMIKLFSREPIFKKKKITGRKGIAFTHYSYPVKRSDEEEFLLGFFLKKSRLSRLPSVINIWKGDLALIGPRPYPVEWCDEWNKHLSDFYKRFSFKPGFLSVSDPVTDPSDIGQVNRALTQELQYILEPSIRKNGLRLINKRN